MALILAFALVVVMVALGAYYFQSPYYSGVDRTPAQPVPFSHKHHVGELGLDCRYCHTSVEQSSFAGVPESEICMTCHSQLWTNADMLAPVRACVTTSPCAGGGSTTCPTTCASITAPTSITGCPAKPATAGSTECR